MKATTALPKKNKSNLVSDATLGVLIGAAIYQVALWWMPSLSSNPQRLTVDLSDRTLTTATGEVYSVSVGTEQDPTPTGSFVVRQMDVNGGKNAVFARGFLPVNLGFSPFLEWGFYAIHGAADGETEGCIALSDTDYSSLNLEEGDIVVIQP